MVLGCWGIGVENALLKLFVVKIDLSRPLRRLSYSAWVRVKPKKTGNYEVVSRTRRIILNEDLWGCRCIVSRERYPSLVQASQGYGWRITYSV
jgi:hypothetical protein